MADPLDIPDSLTLPALQNHMRAQCATCGWDQHSHERSFLLFVEEVGELAKAIRRTLKLQIEQDNPAKPVLDELAIRENLAEELGDVFNYVIEIANRFNLDLDAIYRQGYERDRLRVWKTA